MDLKKIRSFIVLATSSSFRDAAKKLNLTQPALTKQIQMLEARLGFMLFLRDNQGCHLTDAGKIVYKYAISLNDQIDTFLGIAKKIKTGQVGALNIGYTFSFINILPNMINEYSAHNPMINIKMYELSTGEIEKKLITGELDLAFIEKTTNKQLVYEDISSDHLLIISNKEKKLQFNNIEDIAQILDNNMLCIPKINNSADLTQKITKYLSINSLNVSNIHFTGNLYSTVTMINLHSNVAILPNSLVNTIKSPIKIHKLLGKGIKWKIGIAWNKSRVNFHALSLIEEIKLLKNNNTIIRR